MLQKQFCLERNYNDRYLSEFTILKLSEQIFIFIFLKKNVDVAFVR